jgi:signal transduction histidine kinase
VAGDRDRAARTAAHLRGVIDAVAHSSYARHLTATVHSAAMDEAFSELTDKNKRLAAAVERLKEVDRLKSNFLATISHELRTPLTSVIGYAEMLLEGMAGDVTTEQQEYLHTILSKADQLLQLITGILDISLIESKAVKILREPVSVLEIIDGAVTSMANEAERRGVVITLPRLAVPRVLGDRRKLRQVLLHLIANAIKFSPAGGDVIIDARVGPMSPADTATFASPFWIEQRSQRFGVRIAVRDVGIGIADDKHLNIFEPFYQVDSSSTRAFGGTGLGLTLAKSYVEAHGGSIWVESEPGKGSTFTVSLPAVPEELEAHAAQSPGSESPR